MKIIRNKYCLFVFIIFLSISASAQEVKKTNEDGQGNSNQLFDGFYFGATIGIQNIYGGAFIDDLDLLAQKSGFVLELSTGYRKQFHKSRFLVGIEIHYGFTDGDMVETDPRYQFDVFYTNSTQRGFGLLYGVIVGSNKNFLIHGYTNLTTRNFDIEFTEADGTFHTQEDEESFLRYGVGVEVHIKKRFNIRTSIGKLNADFGDKITSQDVEDKIDINLGIVYQF